MRRKVRLRAFAKVNYALEVLGLREDCYHELATVMQSISLADELEMQRGSDGLELSVEPEGTGVGSVEDSTVYKVWARLRELTGEELPVRVCLRKEIPPAAGLGGASADAAATLVGLDELFGLALEPQTLIRIGREVGADVPFCLAGGTALGAGVGEVLTPLPPPPEHYLVLAKPGRGASTAMIYRSYDESPRASVASVLDVVSALKTGDLPALAGSLGNDLAPITGELVPEVAHYVEELLDAGALGAGMSGSGTAVYGIFEERETARKAEGKLRAGFTGTFEPVRGGVEVVED